MQIVQPALAAWQNFYVIIGTAAATLTGLMFIVITLIAGVRVRVSLSGDGVAVFSTPTVVHLCTALLIAALLSAPWPALWHVSLLLGLAGLWGIIYTIIVIRRMRRQMSYQPVLEDWLSHTVLPLIAYIALITAASLLPTYPTPALFIVAATTLLLLFIGIHNAWDNITYTAIELPNLRSKSQD